METPRFDKPGPKPQPSPKAILSAPPRGAIARRNRVLKIYGVILLAGLLGLVGYCALRPGFDLSTPERTMASLKRCLDKHRWSQTTLCLTPDCYKHYGPAIEDRTLFDFYSPYGYSMSGYRFIPDWQVRKVERTGPDSARAWVYSGAPLISEELAGFWMYLVRCPDGLWRVDGPRENYAAWYNQLIPQEARGWGATEERH